VTTATLFQAASISKPVAAAAALALIEAGRLDLDEDVNAKLRSWHVPRNPFLEQAPVTLRGLLSHTAGLTVHGFRGYAAGDPVPNLLQVLDGRAPANSQPIRVDIVPGRTWRYSGGGYTVMQQLVQDVTGREFSAVMQDLILARLGMDHSTYEQPLPDGRRKSAATGHRADGRPIPGRWHTYPERAAAGLWTTPTDLARFAVELQDSLRGRSNRILSSRSVRRMLTPGPGGFGLGLAIEGSGDSRRFEHGGSNEGFKCKLVAFAHRGQGAVVMANGDGGSILGEEILRAVAWAYGWPAYRPIERELARVDPATLDVYTGRYRLGPDVIATLTRQGDRFSIELPGLGRLEAFPGSDAELFVTDFDARIRFVKDGKGRVTHLVADWGGAQQRAERLEDRADARADANPKEPPAAPGGAAARPATVPYDVVILGGRVVDGTGNAWFRGDVAFLGDRIARIAPAGLLRDAAVKERIDAKGLVVCPGFIDIQGQSREALLSGDGRLISKVTQGVTTEILGEGWTDAPANERTIAISRVLEPEVTAHPKELTGPHGFDAWLRIIQRHGSSVNFGSFVGSATVRAYARGMDQGAPSAEELDVMRRLVRGAMEDGAFGLASALIYPPDNYVRTEDLVELAKAMAPYGGVYISHIRSEADRFLEAIDEAIEIGRKGGVPVEIYHLKAAGRRNWSKAEAAIARIAAARAQGLDVGADMYPYVAGATGLTSVLPPSASAGGKLFDRLADPAERSRIRAEVLDPKTQWENMGQLATPEGILVLGLDKPENKKYAGKRLSEIAGARGQHWLDAAMDLILSERQGIGTVYFMMSEENVKLQMRQPWIKFGTDADGIDPDHPKGLAHPRAYGTYPRILGRYVRDEKAIPLEDAIRKMTSAVAARLSISDRGVLHEGTFADVVVFDAATIADRATFEKPHQVSVGVRHVFVNGTAVVRDGRHTGAKPGRIVRGPGHGVRSAP
jgi:dihydroorotase/N-acyl-D-amino-acid deacylase